MNIKNLKTTAAAIITLGLSFAGQSHAGVLLNLIDPPGQSNTPTFLSFVASAATTDIVFAGYQVPSGLNATGISLTTGGGPNLLGPTWNFTPAGCGSIASQFDDGLGTGTNGLGFAGVCTGSYDQFDQAVATNAGQSYDVNFLFSNSGSNAPSGFMVSTDAADAPEPASAALLLAGLGGLAIHRMRLRAKASKA